MKNKCIFWKTYSWQLQRLLYFWWRSSILILRPLIKYVFSNLTFFNFQVCSYRTLWVWRIHRVKKFKGKFRWKHLDRYCRNAKTSNWKKFIQGIKSCHLTQAGQTARFWQFGWPVLGGSFWFPGWFFFIFVFWHSFKAYLNVFTWICLWTFFYPMHPSNPQCIHTHPCMNENVGSWRKSISKVSIWMSEYMDHWNMLLEIAFCEWLNPDNEENGKKQFLIQIGPF